MQSYLVKIFTEDELKDLLNELFLDDTVDLLEDLPANLVTRILENVDSEKRNRINQLLNYPEDSAGSVMTTEYVDLRKHTTVREALAHIKQTGIHKETIYTCYILENRRLLGIVTAKDLMTMDDDLTMEELMETETSPYPPIPIRKKSAGFFPNMVCWRSGTGSGRTDGRHRHI